MCFAQLFVESITAAVRYVRISLHAPACVALPGYAHSSSVPLRHVPCSFCCTVASCCGMMPGRSSQQHAWLPLQLCEKQDMTQRSLVMCLHHFQARLCFVNAANAYKLHHCSSVCCAVPHHGACACRASSRCWLRLFETFCMQAYLQCFGWLGPTGQPAKIHGMQAGAIVVHWCILTAAWSACEAAGLCVHQLLFLARLLQLWARIMSARHVNCMLSWQAAAVPSPVLCARCCAWAQMCAFQSVTRHSGTGSTIDTTGVM